MSLIPNFSRPDIPAAPADEGIEMDDLGGPAPEDPAPPYTALDNGGVLNPLVGLNQQAPGVNGVQDLHRCSRCEHFDERGRNTVRVGPHDPQGLAAFAPQFKSLCLRCALGSGGLTVGWIYRFGDDTKFCLCNLCGRPKILQAQDGHQWEEGRDDYHPVCHGKTKDYFFVRCVVSACLVLMLGTMWERFDGIGRLGKDGFEINYVLVVIAAMGLVEIISVSWRELQRTQTSYRFSLVVDIVLITLWALFLVGVSFEWQLFGSSPKHAIACATIQIIFRFVRAVGLFMAVFEMVSWKVQKQEERGLKPFWHNLPGYLVLFACPGYFHLPRGSSDEEAVPMFWKERFNNQGARGPVNVPAGNVPDNDPVDIPDGDHIAIAGDDPVDVPDDRPLIVPDDQPQNVPENVPDDGADNRPADIPGNEPDGNPANLIPTEAAVAA